MNIASKITSLTSPNGISLGENVYCLLGRELQSEFQELSIPTNNWKAL